MKGAILTDNLIIQKAIEIGEKNNIDDFKASRGWLEKFKDRHNLKKKKFLW